MSRRPLLFILLLVVVAFAIASTWLGNHMSDVADGTRVLPARAFEGVTVVFLGTGGSHANHQRGGPAIGIGSDETLVLVDAGRGIAEALREDGLPVAQARAVYLTSLLPENTVGLDDLLVSGWLDARSEPLRVVGPRGTRALVDGLLAAHATGISGQGTAFGMGPEAARLQAVEITGTTELDEAPMQVEAVLLPDGPVASLAYRFERGRAAVVLGGSAWGGDALVELARGATLLVHEAFFAESVDMAIEAGASDPERLRQEARHRTPLPVAGARARQAGVRGLALVRLRPPPLFAFQASNAASEGFRGQIYVPADGDEIELTP